MRIGPVKAIRGSPDNSPASQTRPTRQYALAVEASERDSGLRLAELLAAFSLAMDLAAPASRREGSVTTASPRAAAARRWTSWPNGRLGLRRWSPS